MRRGWTIGVGLVLLAAVAGAEEAAVKHTAGVTAKVGTLGLGADATVALAPHLNARAGLNAYTFEQDFDLNEANARGSVEWQTVPLLLDWHPFQGGFRLSAGGVINGNEVKLSAKSDQTLEIEDRVYPIVDLEGSIEFDAFSWYVGLGYGNAAARSSRWHFACDFGVMYHGEPQASARATAQDPALQAVLDADLQREVDDFQEDLSQVVLYPVVSLGVSFTF